MTAIIISNCLDPVVSHLIHDGSLVGTTKTRSIEREEEKEREREREICIERDVKAGKILSTRRSHDISARIYHAVACNSPNQSQRLRTGSLIWGCIRRRII